MLANDPGLGNRYQFFGGIYDGKIGYWAGASDFGIYIDWEDGKFNLVSFKEFQSAQIMISNSSTEETYIWPW